MHKVLLFSVFFVFFFIGTVEGKMVVGRIDKTYVSYIAHSQTWFIAGTPVTGLLVIWLIYFFYFFLLFIYCFCRKVGKDF